MDKFALNPTTQFLLTIALIFTAWLAVPLSAHAEDGDYGQYDRPTYFPDFTMPTNWASTMTYFVCARIGNERLHNYEVAVYDQNNGLRATGRSVASQQELCTLTIPGEAGDEFHFKVIYGDFANPTIIDVPETCTFSANEIIGNLEYPYWLTLPEPTAIKSINKEREANDNIFTLSGIRVKEPVKSGIYIKNGKKFIVQ